jgi:hypothetical protein
MRAIGASELRTPAAREQGRSQPVFRAWQCAPRGGSGVGGKCGDARTTHLVGRTCERARRPRLPRAQVGESKEAHACGHKGYAIQSCCESRVNL